MKFLLKFFAFLSLGFFLTCAQKIQPGLKVYDDTVNRQFWSVDWSPDGQYIAVTGVDSTVRIFHPDLTLYKSFHIPSWIHVVKWNADSKTLAVATLDQYVHLIDISTEQIIQLDNSIGPNHLPDGNGSRGIGWNFTGELLAVGGLDGIIKIWNKQGNLKRSIDPYSHGTSFVSYLALDWHPTKNILVAGNFEIVIYDTSGFQLRTMKHTNPEAILLCAEWHPSGEFFVLGDYGFNWEGKNVPSLLHFWSLDGTLIKSVAGGKGEYRNMDWTNDGYLLATASDVLRIWSKDGMLLHEGQADGTNTLWGVSWNRKGNRIVTASRYKTVALWNKNAILLKRIDVAE